MRELNSFSTVEYVQDLAAEENVATELTFPAVSFPGVGEHTVKHTDTKMSPDWFDEPYNFELSDGKITLPMECTRRFSYRG